MLAVGTGPAGGFRPPKTFIIDNVFIEVETASSGTTNKGIFVDVNVDGSTIFQNQGLRPFISGTQDAQTFTTGSSGVPELGLVNPRQKITFDVDQVGDVISGSTLTVQIEGWAHDTD